MKTLRLLLLPLGLTVALFRATLTANAPAIPAPPSVAIAETDRSPMDVALSKDGRFALTANATADSVSLVDMQAGKVLAETRVGAHPFAVALSADGKRGLVTNRDSDSVSILDVGAAGVTVAATLPVGDEPRGVALNAAGTRAYVALAGEDAVAIVDVTGRKVVSRLAVGEEPWYPALTPNGKRLAVGSARAQELAVIDTAKPEVAYTVRLRGHNVRRVAIAPDGQSAYVPNIAERGRPATRENIDMGWVVGNRLSRVSLTEDAPREALALDPRGAAVGDAEGVAVSPDGGTLAVTCGGTHELLLLRQPLPFVAFGGPGDHIEPDLLADKTRFRRVPLGGRPLGVVFAPDGKTVLVANYLSNSLQVVSVETAQVTQTVALGGPATPSLARRGETIFYDADRSFNHWYSCHSCHTEGHTNGATFDTANDGSYNTPKKTLSLRGVGQTGPWTWHGWQKSLRQLAHDSMTKSMQGPEPSDADLDAITAFLQTLAFRPNPNRHPTGAPALSVKRGETVFHAKGCDTCHAPPLYTNSGIYDVGLEEPLDPYKGFNPPSLRGVYNRAPYLHTGAARTLEETLTKFHRASALTGKPDPTPAELRDLVAFLRTL